MGDLQTRSVGDANFSTSSVSTEANKVLRNTYMLLSMTLLLAQDGWRGHGDRGALHGLDTSYNGLRSAFCNK